MPKKPNRKKPDATLDLAYALYALDFASFVRWAWTLLTPNQPLDENWHIDAICYQLEQVESGHERRLMINVPPRALKSLICSVFWAAFRLGRHPELTILVVSHSLSLSIDLANKFRKLVAHPEFRKVFPAFQAQLAKDSETEVNTAQGGGRIATSVEKPITGRGADLIIIDDPIDASDADNEQACSSYNTWHDSTLSTRLNQPATTPIVLVMQRLSIFDPVPHLSAQEPWSKLVLPAIATKDESIPTGKGLRHHRKIGDLLHPSRYPETYLETQKLKMGRRAFEAQFQQNPLLDGAGLIELSEFGRHAAPPKTYDAKIISIDTATGSDSGSYSAILGGRIFNGRLYITHIFRKRMSFSELFAYTVDCIEGSDINHVLIEKASSGNQLLEFLQEKYQYTDRCASFIQFLQPMVPDKTKTVRMEAAMIEVQAGRVSLPLEHSKLEEFEHELRTFPKGKSDDYVDALSQMIKFFHWYMKDPACRIDRGLPPH